MDWIEVSVRGVDGEIAEALSEVMGRYGQGGAVIEHVLATADSAEYEVQPLIVKGYVADGPEAQESIRQLREAIWHLSMIHPIPEPEVRRLDKSNWTESWKEHYVRTRPGERLVVIPAWDEAPVPEGEIPIYIDPGMAFGTGMHPSTQLCLVLLERYLREGTAVFDVGVGSGILSIAAAHLGAGRIVASDTDEVAVEATRENARRNGVADHITVRSGSVDAFGGTYDLIVINILAEVIAALLPGAVERLAPDGRMLLAGIIAEREPFVQEQLARYDLRTVERLDRGDWVGLVVERVW